MENLPPDNVNESVDSDAAIIEAIATIYSNWISNEQKKNEVYICQILNGLQEKICQTETEERKFFIKEQFKRHAEAFDSGCRTSIYGVFYMLNEAIQGENLKKWIKSFLKKKDNYDLIKCFKDLLKIVKTEQRQQEANKDEAKRLAKAQRNKMKRERKKLEKKAEKLETQEKEG